MDINELKKMKQNADKILRSIIKTKVINRNENAKKYEYL